MDADRLKRVIKYYSAKKIICPQCGYFYNRNLRSVHVKTKKHLTGINELKEKLQNLRDARDELNQEISKIKILLNSP